MNKIIWKTEYSLLICIIFAVILFMVPTSFSSKSAYYISRWNSEFNKLEYMFTAMSALADSDVVKNLKSTTNGTLKEKYMLMLVKQYLRLRSYDKKSRYKVHFMNNKLVPKNHLYYFDNLYESDEDVIVGIKYIKKDKGEQVPRFIMMFDMNGDKGPNTWGVDIYGVNIYNTGQIKSIGDGWEIPQLRKDCSMSGTGVSCSHFYRIGGEFRE